MDFIGKKVNLKVTEEDGVKIYTVADPVMENQLRNTYANVRLFPPGSLGIADYKPLRTNVYIDHNGTIYKITKG